MQNPQCEIDPSKIRRSGQVVPPAAFLELSRRRTTGAPIAIGPPGGQAAEPADPLRAQLAHDARNLISAFELSCELLASPGVLAPSFGHYAEDLRRLAGSAARLIEALVARPTTAALRPYPLAPGVNSRGVRSAGGTQAAALEIDPVTRNRHPFPGIEDLAQELTALEGPLRALAGREVHLEIECLPCAGRLALNSEDLLRILINLVANAVEALALTPVELRRRPTLRITAQPGGAAGFLARDRRPAEETVVLAVRDNGPGIAAEDLPHIFDSGFSTRRGRRRTGTALRRESGDAPRGQGLAIVRQLVASAGGAVRAVSPSGLGARFDIELPLVGLGVGDPASTLPPGRLPHLQQNSAQIEKEA